MGNENKEDILAMKLCANTTVKIYFCATEEEIDLLVEKKAKRGLGQEFLIDKVNLWQVDMDKI